MKRFGFSLLLVLIAVTARAQTFPSKPLRIIVPFPAGGIVDLMARSLNDKLAAGLGQPVLVEARPGANASLGTEAVAKADFDSEDIVTDLMNRAETSMEEARKRGGDTVVTLEAPKV